MSGSSAARLGQSQLGNAPPRQNLAPPKAIGEELLSPRLIPEQVEGADPRRDRLDAELFLQVRLQLGLIEIALKRPTASQHAIPEFDRLLAASAQDHLDRHRQQLPAQPPGALNPGGSFA
jgi:hypothetical protein